VVLGRITVDERQKRRSPMRSSVKSFLIPVAVWLFVVVCGSSDVNASTVTFDGHSNTIFGDENTGNGLEIASSDGYDFYSTGDHFHFINMCGFGGPCNATSQLLEDRDYDIVMSKSGGGSFNVSSLQFFGYSGAPGTTITMTGYFTAGGTISTALVAPTDATFYNSGPLAGFTGLYQVTFDATDFFGLENIEVSDATAAIPERPELATLATALLGIALIAVYVRRYA
jgi:hypothetical protein